MALMWRGWRRDLGAGFIGAAAAGVALCGLGCWRDAVFADKMLQIMDEDYQMHKRMSRERWERMLKEMDEWDRKRREDRLIW
jgi:hypothetical protein